MRSRPAKEAQAMARTLLECQVRHEKHGKEWLPESRSSGELAGTVSGRTGLEVHQAMTAPRIVTEVALVVPRAKILDLPVVRGTLDR